jgi:hypothetical protein
MSAPVISAQSSSLAYAIGQDFTFSFTATNSPVLWSIGDYEFLPNGVFLDKYAGRIFGNPSTSGIYKITLKAKNSAGEESDPQVFLLSTHYTSGTENESFARVVTISTETLNAVCSDTTANASTTPTTLRRGDDVLFRLTFTEGGIATGTTATEVCPKITMAKFGIRNADGDILFQSTTSNFRILTKYISGVTKPRYYVWAYLNSDELNDFVASSSTFTTAVQGEFELVIASPSSAVGPATNVLTTKPIEMTISRDIVGTA